MNRPSVFLLACFYFLISPFVYAITYKCTDAKGRMVFSDRPCQSKNNKQEIYTASGDNKGYFTGDASIAEEFFKLVEYGTVESVKASLKAHPLLIHARNKHKELPLNIAAQKTRVEVVKLLVGSGADVNGRGATERTPLFSAANHGRKSRYERSIKIIDYLWEKGANPFLKDKNNGTLLETAAFRGHIHLMTKILSKGVSQQALNQALDEPVFTGELEALELLIQRGADVNVQKGGRGLMFDAAFQNNVEVAKLLMASGYQLEKSGETPLHHAALFGHIEVSEYLIAQGISPNVAIRGQRPLHRASYSNNNDYVRWIIGRGADVNARDKEGNTPLHSAARGNHEETIRLLLSLGADIRAVNQQGKSAFDIAVEKERKKVISVLQAVP